MARIQQPKGAASFGPSPLSELQQVLPGGLQCRSSPSLWFRPAVRHWWGTIWEVGTALDSCVWLPCPGGVVLDRQGGQMSPPLQPSFKCGGASSPHSRGLAYSCSSPILKQMLCLTQVQSSHYGGWLWWEAASRCPFHYKLHCAFGILDEN